MHARSNVIFQFLSKHCCMIPAQVSKLSLTSWDRGTRSWKAPVAGLPLILRTCLTSDAVWNTPCDVIMRQHYLLRDHYGENNSGRHEIYTIYICTRIFQRIKSYDVWSTAFPWRHSHARRRTCPDRTVGYRGPTVGSTTVWRRVSARSGRHLCWQAVWISCPHSINVMFIWV